MYKIMIYIENLEVIEGINLIAAAEIIKKAKGTAEICAVGFNLDADRLKGKFHKILNIITPTDRYNIRNNTRMLKEICQNENFNYILVNASDFGRILAPRLAMSLNYGIVADVTELEGDLEKITMIRPAYDGKIFAGIQSKEEGKAIMTIRSGVYKYNIIEPKESEVKEIIINNIEKNNIEIKNIIKEEITSDIRESNFLISYGGWVTKNEEVEKVKKLCNILAAQIASSKKPVDDELSSREIQVGHSGKIVSPKIYIALGISGAIQHIEGLKDIEFIVSINKDKNAPLNYLANVVIIGDAEEIIEKMENIISN